MALIKKTFLGKIISEIVENISDHYHNIYRFFIEPASDSRFSVDDYLERIDEAVEKQNKDSWRDKVVLGISSKTKGYVFVDPVNDPGQVCIGAMGSGKSKTQAFMVYTRLLTNSDNTFFIFIDPAKNMMDIREAVPFKSNVACAFGEAEKFIPVMDLLSEEIEARKIEFTRVGAQNIYEYEEIMRKKDPSFPGLARVFLCFEEFSVLISQKAINFYQNVDRPGTAAFQFKQMCRISRSYGFNVIISTQRLTSEDVPGTIKQALATTLAHRVSNPNDASLADLPKAADITKKEKGRSLTKEYDYMQAPLLTDDFLRKELPKRVKPLKAKLLAKQVDDFHTALGGDGIEGFVMVKPLKSVLDGKNQFEARDIGKRILKECGFEYKNQDNKALVANLTATRNGISYAVYVLGERNEASAKAIENLKSSLKELKCTSVIAIGLEGSIHGDLEDLCFSTNGGVVDDEELEQFANLIDSKKLFKDESSLATYKERFDNFPLSEAAFKLKEKENSPSETFDHSEEDDQSPIRG